MFVSVTASRAVFSFAATVLTAPTAPAAPAYICASFLVPLKVTNATTIVPPFKAFPVTGTFNISVEYCTPKTPGTKASTVQLLTHGLGFDRSYWDFKLPGAKNETLYSYIDTALSSGYSTFSWDRLGCGNSTAANPCTEIQASVELFLIVELTKALREGENSPHIPEPERVVHVGYSWGSQLTNALAAGTSGSLSDGIILTGYSHLSTYQPLFLASTNFHLAATNQPKRFLDRSSGYLTWADKFSNQYSFFNYPYFDPAVLEYAESTKYPFTVGELISQDVISYNATSYKGPVLYLAAQHDLLYCGDDCGGKLLGPASEAVTTFSGSSSVEVYIEPNVGHAINLHKNATAAFEVVMTWAEKQGL